MKRFRKDFILVLAVFVATFIGWVKGNEAKQKWMYKFRSSFEEKRQLAKKRMAERRGQVALDDIEWASYHNS